MEEIWKDIHGYEGHYKISNFGRVMSFKTKSPIIIGSNNKPNPRTGYMEIQLCMNSVVSHHRIHRLVALSFIPEDYKEGLVVNHKDGNKTNNHVDNLEWCTISENIIHAIKTGLTKTGGDASFSKSVNQYDLDGNLLKTYSCVSEAGKETGLCRHNIGSCASGKGYSYGGFRWSYTYELKDRKVINCLHCNKEIELTRSNKNYCNASCRGSYNKKKRNKKYVSSSRLNCAKNGDFIKYKGNSARCYAWYIWEKGFDGDTILRTFN